jgi:adenylate cyclase 10
MVGREEAYRKVQSIIDRFMKGRENRGFVTVRGSFGSGKTLFVRKILHRLQDKINSNQYSQWKYGERAQILV